MQYINAVNVYLCETLLLKFEESFLELDTYIEPMMSFFFSSVYNA